jgi:hypothetical protein
MLPSPHALLLPTLGAILLAVLTACGTPPATAPVGLSTVPTAQPTPTTATTTRATTPAPTVTRAKKAPRPVVASPTRSQVPARAKAQPLRASRPVVRRGGVWGLGDSIMLGSKPWFSSHGWRVDAVVGRQFSAGVPILRSYASSGSMPRNVVVSLGTNGTVSPSDCRTMVIAAGPARRVFLVNNHADRSWTAGNNRVIRSCAASFAGNRVIVVDWATPADVNPGWFGSDGIHPNATGRSHYTALIGSAIATSGL